MVFLKLREQVGAKGGEAAPASLPPSSIPGPGAPPACVTASGEAPWLRAGRGLTGPVCAVGLSARRSALGRGLGAHVLGAGESLVTLRRVCEGGGRARRCLSPPPGFSRVTGRGRTGDRGVCPCPPTCPAALVTGHTPAGHPLRCESD